jgi:hypothetical protein
MFSCLLFLEIQEIKRSLLDEYCPVTITDHHISTFINILLSFLQLTTCKISSPSLFKCTVTKIHWSLKAFTVYFIFSISLLPFYSPALIPNYHHLLQYTPISFCTTFHLHSCLNMLHKILGTSYFYLCLEKIAIFFGLTEQSNIPIVLYNLETTFP